MKGDSQFLCFFFSNYVLALNFNNLDPLSPMMKRSEDERNKREISMRKGQSHLHPRCAGEQGAKPT